MYPLYATLANPRDPSSSPTHFCRNFSPYQSEANGLNADFFIVQHLHDPRYCMYAANDAILRDIGRFGDRFSDTIVASENLVRAWSMTGVPQDDSVIGWDVMSDPTVATRFLGRDVVGRQTPGQLSVVEFCLGYRAFLLMDMPVSDVYCVCMGEDDVTKKFRSTVHSRHHAARARRASSAWQEPPCWRPRRSPGYLWEFEDG